LVPFYLFHFHPAPFLSAFGFAFEKRLIPIQIQTSCKVYFGSIPNGMAENQYMLTCPVLWPRIESYEFREDSRPTPESGE